MMAVLTAPETTRTRDAPRNQVVGAWAMMLGYAVLLTGMIWDGQWHGDVGPDSFFTAPHLLLYTGPAIVGLTCLIVVLRSTWGTGRSSQGAPAVTVFRIFRAPWPFLIGGLGSAGNFLYGAADLWWHEVYGFDIAAGATPSHLGLALCIQVEIVAMVLAFAVLRRTRTDHWGLAIALGLATLGSVSAFGMVSELTLGWALGTGSRAIGIGMIGALVLCLAAGLTRTARWPAAVGCTFVAIQGGLALFAPAATEWYADAVDQPMREYATGLPQVLIGFPPTFLVVALLTAAAVWWSARREVSPVGVTAAVGAVSALNVGGFFAVLGVEMNVPATLLVAAGIGAGTGWFGWRCAGLLRRVGWNGQEVTA